MAILNLNFFIMFYILFNNSNQIFKDLKLGIARQDDISKLDFNQVNYLIKCTNTIAKIDINLEETKKLTQIEKDTEINLKSISNANHITCNANGKYLLKAGTQLDLCYIDFLEIEPVAYKETKILPRQNSIEPVEAMETLITDSLASNDIVEKAQEDTDSLDQLSKEELVKICEEKGIEYHHKNSIETLIKNIQAFNNK